MDFALYFMFRISKEVMSLYTAKPCQLSLADFNQGNTLTVTAMYGDFIFKLTKSSSSLMFYS